MRSQDLLYEWAIVDMTLIRKLEHEMRFQVTLLDIILENQMKHQLIFRDILTPYQRSAELPFSDTFKR
ncbi:MAG: hypothetical protein C0494_09410 [Sphingobium sp.]|nr:hypothetical protein [Sphingobium sp.]